MIFIESNAADVFADVVAVLEGVPGVLGRQQGPIQSAIHAGLTDQFDALGHGEPVPSTDGDTIAWDAISPLTEYIRQTRWNAFPESPILHVTGSLRQGLADGATYLYDHGREAILTYFPSVTQQDRIEQHEEGFEVTSPIAAGHHAPSRPMLFWGEELGEEMIRILERGIDNLARGRGFT